LSSFEFFELNIGDFVEPECGGDSREPTLLSEAANGMSFEKVSNDWIVRILERKDKWGAYFR